jgi:hypothetical protein
VVKAFQVPASGRHQVKVNLIREAGDNAGSLAGVFSDLLTELTVIAAEPIRELA